MALAKYFSKDLLAINQVLRNTNKNLEAVLNVPIGIALDTNAVESLEGKRATDLLIRLLARLYPNLVLIDLSGKNEKTIKQLKALAISINKDIQITKSTENLSVLVVLGLVSNIPAVNCPSIFIGSDNWLARLSSNNQQKFTESDNPFGCGIAACLAASNVFRVIFKDFLQSKEIDTEVCFSVHDYNSMSEFSNPAFIPTNVEKVALVGLGAIGNGTLWALSNSSLITGTIDLIDHEDVALSNLQRYVMCCENDIGKSKVILASEILNRRGFAINSFQTNWEGYLKQINNWNINTVAVAIDNKKDRINIQSALPKQIFNSYTEKNLVGIARHTNFLNYACVACGYLPNQKERNYTEEVAENCNIPTLSNLVKDYMNLNLGVDSVLFPQNTASLLDMISQANDIPREKLLPFHGKSVNQFYSEFVCGGISLSMSTSEKVSSNIDAPLAFQSAMAGILLAAEIVLENNLLRQNLIKQQSHFYPLDKISNHNPFNHNLEKDKTGRCICRDEGFRKTYEKKWHLIN